MELIQAIALLCQIHPAYGDTYKWSEPHDIFKYQTQCQQSYLNCVLKRKSIMSETEALQKCILEK